MIMIPHHVLNPPETQLYRCQAQNDIETEKKKYMGNVASIMGCYPRN